MMLLSLRRPSSTILNMLGLFVLLLQQQPLSAQSIASAWTGQYLNFTLKQGSEIPLFYQHEISGDGGVKLDQITFQSLPGDEGLGSNPQKFDPEKYTSASLVDVFHVQAPERRCESGHCHSDWPDMGIGAMKTIVAGLRNLPIETTSMQWCCNEQAIFEGLCPSTRKGRAIMDAYKMLDHGVFHREVLIPNKGPFHLTLSHAEIQDRPPGKYMIIVTNCAKNGRNVNVFGAVEFTRTVEFKTTSTRPQTESSSIGTTANRSALRTMDYRNWIFFLLGGIVLGLVLVACISRRFQKSRQSTDRGIKHVPQLRSSASPTVQVSSLGGVSLIFDRQQLPEILQKDMETQGESALREDSSVTGDVDKELVPNYEFDKIMEIFRGSFDDEVPFEDVDDDDDDQVIEQASEIAARLRHIT